MRPRNAYPCQARRQGDAAPFHGGPTACTPENTVPVTTRSRCRARGERAPAEEETDGAGIVKMAAGWLSIPALGIREATAAAGLLPGAASVVAKPGSAMIPRVMSAARWSPAARFEDCRRQIRVDPDVEFGLRGGVAPADRAAHDHQIGNLRAEARTPGEELRKVAERARRRR